tara:strand:+ start:1 stop:1188 length:1188 start_codon:yes stop_codon:yes gene_type:complete
MIRENFHEKIALMLGVLILTNYLFLSLNFSEMIIKINFIIFIFILITFYFKNFFENIYLKIFFLIIIFISLGTPTFEWDPRSLWLFHAKRIFYDNSIFSVADNYAKFSQNDLPTLIPAFSSSLATVVGYWNEVFPKISFSLAFLPPLILFYAYLKKTTYIAYLSIVLFTIGKYLFNGWADGLLAVYFGSSLFIMYIFVIKEKNIISDNILSYFIAITFFTILTLIKNEGSALLLVLFTTSILTKIYYKEFKKNIFKFLILSLSLIPIFFWKYFCYSNGISYNHFVNENTLFNLLTRYDDIKNYLQISYFIFLNEKVIICFVFFLLSFLMNYNKKLFEFILFSVLLYIIILFFVYLSTPYDFYWQLNSTAARVVKSISFSFAFIGLYNLNDKKIFS